MAEARFPGISPDSMWLLAENRFHDSREFYEQHKPRIRREIIEPLRALLAELAPAVLAIDPQIVVNPNANGCVSRVRRDNRYTHDRSMYRENMWVAFLRDKKIWPCVPGFYADIALKGSSWGMGFYNATPAYMQALRKRIDADPAPILKAARQAADAGFSICGERYARPKGQGLPPLLDELYNRRNLDFTIETADPAFFGGHEMADTLERGFRALAPMYRVLIRIAEEELEKQPRG